MEKIIYVIVCVLIVFVVGIVTLQFMSFKDWLVWAVTQAENKLGSGTGQLKLKYAYDLAIERFPIIAKVIPFALFSRWVDAALDKMKEMIVNNKTIAEVIRGEFDLTK